MADIDNLPQTDTDVSATDASNKEVVEESVEKKSEEKSSTFSPFEDTVEKKASSDQEDTKGSIEIDEEDRKVMEAVIKDESKGIVSEVEGLKVDMKVNTFLAEDKNKLYRPYADKIREYAKSPAAKGLKAEAIARLAVDPREMMAMGAEEERKASKESRDSVSAGGTIRVKESSDKLPNAWDMSRDKFQQVIDKIKRNR